MKLQIKTLNQKSLQIEIEDTKSVYDLKKELSLYPDVGVEPALQKIIYSGKVLNDNDGCLGSLNIDSKKFLVVMILKQPEGPVQKPQEEQSTTTASASSSALEASGKPEFKVPTTPKEKPAEYVMVDNIVNMGYPEVEVRRALLASFNNPERAIEYLIEGIPESSALPEFSTPERRMASHNEETDEDLTMSPFEMFRSDPYFQSLRRAVLQHPELVDQAIQRVGEANPSIYNLIQENQQEFLSMLISDEDDDDDEYEDEEDDDET